MVLESEGRTYLGGQAYGVRVRAVEGLDTVSEHS